jgi:WD40 repeat protein
VKFDAFISYRRVDGSAVAQRLRQALRGYRLPAALRTGDERRLSIYLDTIFERADDDFFDNTIKPALAESKFLIVVLTPEVLEPNNWVQREIDYFRHDLKRGQNILFTTAWDDWVTAVPPELGASPRAEVVDLRGYRSLRLGRRHARVHDELLKLVATLFDVPAERMPELRQEEERQRLSRQRRISAVLAGVVVAMALLLWYAVAQRNAYRRELASGYILNARMNADTGDIAASLLWIASATRLHDGDSEDSRIDRIRFATALRASPHLLRVQPGEVSGLMFDPSGRRWMGYGETGADIYDTATGRRLLHLGDRPIVLALFDDTGTKIGTVSGAVVQVRDASTGLPLAPTLQWPSEVFRIKFQRGGSDLAIVDDGGIHVCGVSTTGVQQRYQIADAWWLRYSPDGTQLLTWANTPGLDVRDASTGKSIRHLDAGDVSDAEFSNDGRTVAVGATDGTASLWNAANGTAISKRKAVVESYASVWFSPDGTKLAVLGGDKACILDPRTGASITSTLPNLHSLTNACFTDDSRFVVTLGDGMIRAWDAATGRQLAWIVRRNARALDLRRGLLLVASEHDTLLWSFDFAGSVLLPHDLPNDEITHARFSEAAPRFATAGFSGPIRLWQIEYGVARVIWSNAANSKVDQLAVSREGERILTSERDTDPQHGIARIWSRSRATPLVTVNSDNIFGDVAFSPDGSRFATAGGDNNGRVWSAADGHPITPPLRHHKRVFSIRFSPDGRQVITASEDGSARVWDSTTGALHAVLPHPEPAYAEFSPDGNFIVTAARRPRTDGPTSGSAVLWKPNGTRLQELRHSDNVLHATFSPDGKRVATASLDRTARIWDTATGQPLTPPLQHADRLWFIRFSPDGRLVVTTCYDGTARVWDTYTGLPVTPVFWHRGGVESADFSPDGRWLVTTSRRGDIHLFDLAPDVRAIDLLEADARLASQQKLVAGAGMFPIDEGQFAHDVALLAQTPQGRPLSVYAAQRKSAP